LLNSIPAESRPQKPVRNQRSNVQTLTACPYPVHRRTQKQVNRTQRIENEAIMNIRLSRLVVVCAFALLACVPFALGQNVTGSITGIVTDSTGAVVSGARVTAHDIDTGVDSPTTSNSSGVYNIQFLPIGHYRVTVQANGFNTETLPPFSLEVLQTANFNVALKVGSSTTTVDVSAAAPILNTSDPTIDSTFTANTISNFPLNGLDFSALTLYVPGAVNTNGTSGMTSIERSTFYSDTPNINGNRAQANNYTLDGIDMNETYNNLISYSPAPEALQEIQVITADSPVDYGNVNGAGVVSVLKSGTNQFHGSAYGYLQDYRLDANSYGNNQHLPLPTPINPYSQTQFGGTIGGPIVRNKLFFFGDYLGSRYHKGGLNTASVIPDAFRNGDFSVLLNAGVVGAGNTVQLYDPLNHFAPYANNQGVPIVNPVAKFLFANPSLYPDCGGDNPATPAGGQCLPPSDGIDENNYQAPSRSYKANNQGDVKIEFDPHPSDKITGFYSISHAYDGSTAVLAITFPGINLYPTWLTGANWVHTFSPSLVNSAVIGFTRTDWNQGFPQDPTGQFGTAGNAKVGISFPNQKFNGFTNQGLNGNLSDVGTSAYNGGIIDNTYTYVDTLTWQHRKHYFSMGVTARRYQNNYPTGNNDGYLGSLNYSGNFTSDSALGSKGYGPADFVLDRVSSGGVTLGSVNVGQRQWRTAGFAQDSFKVLPNLTVVFGVRYEFDEPWVEEQDRTGNVDLTTGQIIYAGHLPVGAPPEAGLCSNLACYQPNYRQWMPHLGFAYQFNDRTVLRGGYGATSFFEGNSFNQRLTAIYPFLQAAGFSVTQPTPGSVSTPNTAEEGFTSSDTSVQFSSSNNGYTAYPQNMQPAYVQEFNLTLEYALTRTASLQAGYLGETGQHIEDYGNVNQYTVNNDQTSAPFYNSPYIGVNGVDSVIGVGGNGGLLITESRAMMNYNALQVVLRQRLSHGLEYTVNYTYGKAMTNSLGNYFLNVAGYGSTGAFQNYYNSGADDGVAGYDVKHNISGTGVYALPVGRGKEYFSRVSGLMDEIIGGWKLSTAAISYSGFPGNILGGSSSSNSYGPNRANEYFKMKIVGRTHDHWFGTDPSVMPCTTAGSKINSDGNACAFGVPANYTFGTSKNGSIRGPGYFNVDMSAFKDFHLFENHTVGFRFDAFNAFNIVSYGNPDTGIGDTNFGNVSLQGVRSVERHLQFSAKYTF
jgi:Carboxypeptidase regulatory-like domain/TonB-dependent Receptor Plug Domain